MSQEGHSETTMPDQGTPSTSETERQPERPLLNPEMAATQAALLGIQSNGKLDKKKIEKIGKGEVVPRTQRATKASYYERDVDWRDVDEDQRIAKWKKTTNAFFGQFIESADAGKFLRSIGIHLDGDDIAQDVYNRFFHPQHGKGDIGIMAQAIAARPAKEIAAYRELIIKLGRLYGQNSSHVLILLVEGLKNAEPPTVKPFLEKAETQLSSRKTAEGLKGHQIYTTLLAQAAAWDQKIEKGVGHEEQPDSETKREALSEPALTAELARTDHEKYKELLMRRLQETAYGRRAWEYALAQDYVSLDEIDLDPSENAISRSLDGKKIILATSELSQANQDSLFFSDEKEKIDYKDQMAHKLLHELNHKLYYFLYRQGPYGQVFEDLISHIEQIRRNSSTESQQIGISTVGNDQHYADSARDKGLEESRVRAIEDVLELCTLYLRNPETLRHFLDLLASSDSAAQDKRTSLGLATLTLEEADRMYQVIETTIRTSLDLPPVIFEPTPDDEYEKSDEDYDTDQRE